VGEHPADGVGVDEPAAHAAVRGEETALGGVGVELRGRGTVLPARAGRESELVRRGVRVGARAEQVVEQAESEVRVEPHARGVRGRRRRGLRGNGVLGLRVAWQRRRLRLRFLHGGGGERGGGEEEGDGRGRHCSGSVCVEQESTARAARPLGRDRPAGERTARDEEAAVRRRDVAHVAAVRDASRTG